MSRYVCYPLSFADRRVRSTPVDFIDEYGLPCGRQQVIYLLTQLITIYSIIPRRDVTFLYKLISGVCSKSYGMNVAGMAGVPSTVINMAEEKAHQFELATGFSASTTG